MKRRQSQLHPEDSHTLDDWYTYGPKDAEIAELVGAIAERGIRLTEIENAIKAMLRVWLDSFPPAPDKRGNRS